MAWGEDKYLEFEGEILIATGKAINFLADFWKEPAWLPRSQIIIEQEEGSETKRANVKIKEWLCQKSGWEEV